MKRLGLGLAVWVTAAVPVALLLGRLLAASSRSIADEAAEYLRRQHPHAMQRRRRAVATVGLLAVAGLATGASAREAAQAVAPHREGIEVAAPAVHTVRRAPSADDLPPITARRALGVAASSPSPSPTPPRLPRAPQVGEVLAPAVARICTILDEAFGIAAGGACAPVVSDPAVPSRLVP